MEKNTKQKLWYQLPIREVFARVDSRPGGLTSEEVAERRKDGGDNTLPDSAQLSWVSMILAQLKSPLVYVLLIAAGISFFVGETIDVVVILSAVFINTAVGFWQEFKADQTLKKLKSLVEHKVTVVRDGKEQLILAEELVKGDMLMLEAGDRISADARIVETNNAQVDEASLTGESFPVDKYAQTTDQVLSVGDRHNMVFLGTTVTRGRIRAVVIAIGESTEIGQIASLVKATEEEKTPLQKEVERISRFLTGLVILAAAGIFAIGFFRGLDLEELFVTSAALAVAAIPEGLLVAMTLVLVFGMKRILKRRVLIRKLIAAETLGSVSIVCSDKTGTITEGVMQVDQMVVGGKIHKNHKETQKIDFEEQHILALKIAALCNDAYIQNPEDKLKESQIIGDATDSALLQAALQAGFTKEELNAEFGRLDEIPFNENYKFQATLHQNPEGEKQIFLKGAPENILSMCSFLEEDGEANTLDQAKMAEIRTQYESMTRTGLRVLALAYKKESKAINSFDDLALNREEPAFADLVFVGWVGLKDPVRKEAPAAFLRMKEAGIRTVIITGDHKFTVKAIVEELGMKVKDHHILEGTDIEELTDEELAERVEQIDIYARVEPRHKLRIIQAWKKKGAVVAMLGDGVNDAPALKAADIGVAIGDATDVAKESSDMILLDGDFSSIEAAIKEGRVLFDNIRKIFLYLMADSFTEMGLIGLALIFGFPLPLLVVHILFINILSDGIINLALTVEPGESDIMNYPPRKPTDHIISREIITLIVAITGIAIIAAFSLFAYFFQATGDLAYTRTLVFTIFTIDSAIYVFSIKSLRQPLWKTNMFSNPWLVFASLLVIAIQVAVVYHPVLQTLFKTVALKPEHWFIILGIAFVEVIIREVLKWAYWHKSIRG